MKKKERQPRYEYGVQLEIGLPAVLLVQSLGNGIRLTAPALNKAW
jgi:hypothetical protein